MSVVQADGLQKDSFFGVWKDFSFEFRLYWSYTCKNISFDETFVSLLLFIS
jgi:hypothetical protein